MHDSPPSNDLLLELRKKARRRLVGAVVLALLIATILPMFLESDPKPLGEDVQIDIPAISEQPSLPSTNLTSTDNTIANVSPNLQPTEPNSPTIHESAVSTAPATTNTPLEPQSAPTTNMTPAAKTAVPTTLPKEEITSSPPKKPSESSANKPSDTEAKTAKSTTPPAVSSAHNSSGTNTSNNTTKEQPKKNEHFWIQLGVFTNPKKAQNVLEKAKKLGFRTTLEKTTSEKNTATKVKIGPYTNRTTAETARDQLKEAGLTGFIITP